MRIAIQAASLNFPDLLIVQNKYQIKPPLPFVPGSEFAGVVEAVGDGVTHLKVGDAVAAFGGTGGFATHACVDATLVHAAAAPASRSTTRRPSSDLRHLAPRADRPRRTARPAKRCWCSARPAASAPRRSRSPRRSARASSPPRRATRSARCAASIGADATINYRASDDLREAIKALTDGKGPDVVYDPVGGDLAEPAFRSIAWRGRYLVVGFAGGGIPALPLNLALLKGASIVGVFWGDFARREPQGQRRRRSAELARWYAAGQGQAGDRHAPADERRCRRPTRAWARARCAASSCCTM